MTTDELNAMKECYLEKVRAVARWEDMAKRFPEDTQAVECYWAAATAVQCISSVIRKTLYAGGTSFDEIDDMLQDWWNEADLFVEQVNGRQASAKEEITALKLNYMQLVRKEKQARQHVDRKQLDRIYYAREWMEKVILNVLQLRMSAEEAWEVVRSWHARAYFGKEEGE